MKKFGRWIKFNIRSRPFFSAMVLLIIVVTPGFVMLQNAVDKSDKAAHEAQVVATNLAAVLEREDQQQELALFTNCQIRNTATKNGRDRFDTFFTAIEIIFTNDPEQTPEENQQAVDFVDNLREAVPLDPLLEDVDCNLNGVLDPEDYG